MTAATGAGQRAYRYRHVVTLDETNVVGNVYFARYLHWQGHCRERFLADHAPGVVARLRAGTLTLATVSCAMDYYRECYALDEIEVAMTLGTRGGNRIGMDFVFYRGADQVARGTQTVVCLRRTPDGVAPVDIPGELAAALDEYTQEVRGA